MPIEKGYSKVRTQRGLNGCSIKVIGTTTGISVSWTVPMYIFVYSVVGNRLAERAEFCRPWLLSLRSSICPTLSNILCGQETMGRRETVLLYNEEREREERK